MQKSTKTKLLIVNADDFGKDNDVNEAVLEAHKNGILTTASLMVNEDGATKALIIAKENKTLGVGLHLSLLFDKPALNKTQIPDLVGNDGKFHNSPVKTGFNCYFKKRLRRQLELEISAQVKKFQNTGLPLDHLNGHLHFHMQPVVFNIIMENAEQWGIKAIRLTRDPLSLNLKLSKERILGKICEATTFGLLSAWCRRKLEKKNIKFADQVFGLLQNGHVDPQYLINLIKILPSGITEIYSHPSKKNAVHEFKALIDTEAKNRVCENQIKLVRYQDI
ncbi:MAG: hopanoid biosynthesis-associated protein HpnK [Verrucomicrobiae bacterium]|nr:hopanoid biosynthesis-associated protein HpnK [Verrucomicrobiae bacterium]